MPCQWPVKSNFTGVIYRTGGSGSRKDDVFTGMGRFGSFFIPVKLVFTYACGFLRIVLLQGCPPYFYGWAGFTGRPAGLQILGSDFFTGTKIFHGFLGNFYENFRECTL